MVAYKRLGLALLVLASMAGLVLLAYQRPAASTDELTSRMPRPAPYDVAEARDFPPPYEEHWESHANPGRCATCHPTIFAEWNGSMMSNAWRDPGWRAAFLLVARMTSTFGDCDAPSPPDGTPRSQINPFAVAGCASRFDVGTGFSTLSRSGSLLDPFCSQCHMPSNFVDNVPLATVEPDPVSGIEHAKIDPEFNPTSDNGTGVAFAPLESRFRNTASGQRGIFCAVCHSVADTREMPFGNYHKSGIPYGDGKGRQNANQDRLQAPDPASPNQGYAIGAGAFRLSPRALVQQKLLGPLAAVNPANPAKQGEERDDYLSGVFKTDVARQRLTKSGHAGFYSALHERAEMCAACHDVTNPLPIRNKIGRWVGGFPIERTYTEWASSRYADRPGNRNFDPRFKRDCQTCHMQQDFGQPGTAQTLYRDGKPVPPRSGRVAEDAPEHTPAFSHHFIGGNTYVPRLAGADVDTGGAVEAYPQLSVYSFTSADEKSLYHNAFWENVGGKGPVTQHARLAWDRLRNVLDMELEAPPLAVLGSLVPLKIAVTNSGSGHDFPSGFPEGRVAWLAVRAYDLGTGRELALYDSHWKRTSKGVGYLTREEMRDPNFPLCRDWKLPAGSPDPYAVQFKAIASLGDGCPTLDLPYATPLNLQVDANGLPVDGQGRTIDRSNPRGLPSFVDRDGDGDLFDDSFLSDTRLRPLPNSGATSVVDRYSVVIPADAKGPVAVVTAVYYQSFEAVVAKKFLGNLADLDTDFRIEPCVLGGACDGRRPAVEPAVVEGAPPVPMEVRSRVVELLGGAVDTTPPGVRTYPPAGTRGVAPDVVVKAVFTEPVAGLDASTFTLEDDGGKTVPAFVDAIGDGTWGLFPHGVFLEPNRKYTARVAAGVCDLAGNCTHGDVAWSFTTGEKAGEGAGDTGVPLGFPAAAAPTPAADAAVTAVRSALDGTLAVDFSRPVMNVSARTLQVHEGAAGDCSRLGAPLPGRLAANPAGDRWAFKPDRPARLGAKLCVALSPEIYDLRGRGLAGPYRVGVAGASEDRPR